jgi:NAD(P)H-dependent FMN reductase
MMKENFSVGYVRYFICLLGMICFFIASDISLNDFTALIENSQFKIEHSQENVRMVLMSELNLCQKQSPSPLNIAIILGAFHPTGTGAKIARNIKTMLDKNPRVRAEILDIIAYNLPCYTDTVPAVRKEGITDPILKRWSDKIRAAAAYIIVVPEYNAGYPSLVKNAIDSLYTEWQNKPVAIVGYSGGKTGGTTMIAQLRQVLNNLKMIPVEPDIKIPQSRKALDKDGRLVNYENIEKDIDTIVKQLLMLHNADRQS